MYRFLLLSTFFLIVLGCNPTAKPDSTDFSSDDQTSIETSLHKSAEDWNRSDLDAFMSLYDSSATFMMRAGPVGLDSTRSNYEKSYFSDSTKKQDLRFSEILVRPLGQDHALVTGKFTLYGKNLPEQSGRYTLVFVRTNGGWKILHDHSS